MSSATVRQGAIGVIRRMDGHFLVIERSALVRAPGKLCFPGGGIEPGEAERDAVIRELDEELSLQVSPVRRVWRSQTPNGVELHWWLTLLDPTSQRPQPNPAEVARVTWMSEAEMLAAPALLATNQSFLLAVKAGTINLRHD